ncbi:MAG: thiamine phosphate synthase [Bacillota bacterium]|nr:thiamine phosphate synthase [Bacillota bacterium]
MVDLPILVVSDRRLFPGDPEGMVRALCACLRGGARGVEVGDSDLAGHDLLALALRLREPTRQAGGLLLVAERADVALAAEADGVHLGCGALPAPAVRKLARRLNSSFLIGRSVTTVEEAALGQLEDADFLVFTPVWPEPGLDALRAVAASVRRPVLAGGGLTPEQLPALREVGVAGLVLGREVLEASDPERETARFLAAWQA